MLLSVVIQAVYIAGPPALIIFMLSKRAEWAEEDFAVAYGSMLQGIELKTNFKGEHKKSLLLVPLIFFTRRFLIVIVLLF